MAVISATPAKTWLHSGRFKNYTLNKIKLPRAYVSGNFLHVHAECEKISFVFVEF